MNGAKCQARAVEKDKVQVKKIQGMMHTQINGTSPSLSQTMHTPRPRAHIPLTSLIFQRVSSFCDIAKDCSFTHTLRPQPFKHALHLPSSVIIIDLPCHPRSSLIPLTRSLMNTTQAPSRYPVDWIRDHDLCRTSLNLSD
eukprot:TRINITY_DN9426_c0_g1::TRINITY_DN9426_c0_g1_i1::g.210::m.210 TRINITY_DN9426_c0_g1::TRINITY_DN9426_c0_g1_i1::g.210  ORF type:complete len:140 (+),score=18.67 TRINITY_DN9426_c0_g1_i1:345-764(+)